MTPLRIIFAGSGAFGIPTLRAQRDAGHKIVSVITQPDRPAGRGRTLTPTPIAIEAETIGLPPQRVIDINAMDLPPADLLVVIAFGQKIADRIVNHARLGSINLHASRLPRHRGAAPINAAILCGDSVTGNSVIRLAQKMDAGAILAQSIVSIGELETAGELHDRLSQDGAPLVLGVIEQLANHTAIEIEQDHVAATLARKLSRESARIDWTQSAQSIARQIRGLSPWPGCRVELLDGERVLDTITLLRARAFGGTGGPVGIIAADGTIAAGDGNAVEVIDVQPAGKRPMSLDAYARGKRWETGLRPQSP
ncbi:MAG: methionyl-tRNA formyltransferase [Phycisphaerae bacterium]|nr:methionyl-tRNA formyltransferase [Phycisphaerae bacterium]